MRIVGVLAVVAAASVPTVTQAQLARCPGRFIRNSQGYDFGARRPNLVRAGPVAREGSEAIFDGISTIRGKVYVYVGQRLYPGADVQLNTGCRLPDLDPNEPD